MKIIIRIINTIAIILSLFYIFFTHKFYEIIINLSGNTSGRIFTYSNIPYYLLWLALIISIIIKIVLIVLKKKKNIVVIFPSDVVVLILLLSSIIFTPRFEFIEHYDNDSILPECIRYDNLFIRNEFYSNEGDFEGGYGDTKYIYIPIMKKMIYIDSKGIKNYDVEYKDNNKVIIDNKEYKISQTWFTES